MSAEPTLDPVLRMTEEDFVAKYVDLKPAYEYVNGEVTQKPMPKRPHTYVAEELVFQLGLYRRGPAGGKSGPEPTVNLSRGADRRYRAPDVGYWGPDRADAQPDNIFLAPTLAIEIQSPGQTLTHLRAKCREYRERGTAVAWLVRPSSRTVEVWDEAHEGAELREGDELTSAHLPGLVLPVRQVFAALD
ncbi:MAG: Uma2 family endonuclease [Dehalococcoidia bacterium]|nr:Uma2 family endonuclease [Dehalococcoidia bacterium]